MASGNSGVAHDTGEAMDVQPQHEEKPTSSSMSISTAEPMEITDTTIDSDVNEKTKNTPTTLDRFPKYVDCYETLVELAYFKWITGFRLECRKISRFVKTELFFGLFYLFCKIIPQDVRGCRNKINKSSLVKSYLEQSMLFFRGYYKTIKKDKGDTLDVIYYDGMSSMVAYYIDLDLMSNQRFKENPSHIKISSKINTMLFGFLDQKIEYIFDSVFQLFYLFNVKCMPNVESIMLPVCRKLLSNHPMPRKINFLTYMRYILCFKLWKRLINNSSSMGESVKRNKLEILTKYLEQLNVPNDFMSQYEKYNWPNWPTFPKSIMYSNKKQHSSQIDLKKISLFLYDENFPIKKCYKDILNAAPEKDIQMKPILEQCTILRPDLFAISKKNF
ncbi:uncharacterized protein LOC107883288 [Acyrthosiphon pisum]|uniref:Uncharacterized protein n=1 Tax=Acyrthosiphon pisum TaxID=7029 RepID=A0A8R2H6S1_ACYPI|nr:uncharacterized protein LOC107883288 [Acyrthosiphon pisum]|eukprot:XP_016658476.1 PREDICTED: uncharacterized protein LOC107883288 [Acyrthosiphon pisum]